MMSEQHGVLVQPNEPTILEVMQIAHSMAKLSDLTLCGVQRGSVKIMIPKDHIKGARSTGVGECFKMLHKRCRGGGVARNDGGVILGVFEVTEKIAAVFCRCLVKVQITHPE